MELQKNRKVFIKVLVSILIKQGNRLRYLKCNQSLMNKYLVVEKVCFMIFIKENACFYSQSVA